MQSTSPRISALESRLQTFVRYWRQAGSMNAKGKRPLEYVVKADGFATYGKGPTLEAALSDFEQRNGL